MEVRDFREAFIDIKLILRRAGIYELATSALVFKQEVRLLTCESRLHIVVSIGAHKAIVETIPSQRQQMHKLIMSFNNV